jgi:hypothetical protein
MPASSVCESLLDGRLRAFGAREPAYADKTADLDYRKARR